ncbi:beta-glucosidase [Pseudoclavibacter sp. RFBJ3]|uniref:family 1 glycosylhydrolase n=1 Tax=unclassified Pseudoclavibacter TaxID=2615177 RepID=UPI000CE8B032|nr:MULTISPECIES: family 1 glycosylhydrolase [unclassified Pseudoclavibacter]PPF87289.1 beta-glucosidase [Pseudoclavibacter sp. RFBJ5]PPF90293.1 beta-glucosidase [Pseudoclavibacter sp. RFBJ3]PPG00811.1 beta-glucosidase [Pseudoclavibacter sp. RFBH5]PPG26077.1 beta-glucosidase [Pseudoclavibacter sp. RFBI4]
MAFPNNFLWGASTAPHQIEGNNTNSDWWARESLMPGMEPSGDAVDSYHRFRDDMQLLADSGLNSYRFGIEWARIEPRPGHISRAELGHYRRMIETALELGITPVVTLHHFSSPRWFAEAGGFLAPTAPAQFADYVSTVSQILDGVDWVITMNEPNMLAMMIMLQEQMRAGTLEQWQSPTTETNTETDRDRIAAALPAPTPEYGQKLIDAHHAARDALRNRTNAKLGWTVANQAFTATPGNEQKLTEVRHDWEDLYLDAAAGDDFIGVQSYSSQEVDENGTVPHPAHPDNTMVGTAYRPDALGMAVAHTWERTGLPILVTENGIATEDDERRIRYTREALAGLDQEILKGAEVRGYLHWSLLDNYEWGHWKPKFGLISVERDSPNFDRTPKPSLGWLGEVARRNALDGDAES